MRGLVRRGVGAGAVRRGHGRPVRRGAVGDRDDGVVLGGLQHGEAAGGVDGGRLGVRGAEDRDQPAVPVDHRLPGSAEVGQGRGCRRLRGGQGRDGEADGHRGGGQGDEHGGSAHGCGSCRSGRGGAGPPRRTPAETRRTPLPRDEVPAAFDDAAGERRSCLDTCSSAWRVVWKTSPGRGRSAARTRTAGSVLAARWPCGSRSSRRRCARRCRRSAAVSSPHSSPRRAVWRDGRRSPTLLTHPVAGCRTASVTVAPCTTAVAARRGVRQHARGVTPPAPGRRSLVQIDAVKAESAAGAAGWAGHGRVRPPPRRRPRRHRLAPRVVARARRPAARAVHRRLLGRPRHRGRTRPAGPGDDRGHPRPAVVEPPGSGRPHGPGPRPARRRARRRPRRPPDPAHRDRADPGGHAHRAVPRLQGDRHAGLREHRARGRAGADLAPARRGGAVRAAHGPDRPARRHRPRRAGRPVRRGRRLRRGAAAAVGQLGGRRGDPRRGHRPVRRPREAALHRLRGRALLRPRPLDHPATAAGAAGRRRARAPRRRVPARRAVRRPRVRHAARRRPTPRTSWRRSAPSRTPRDAAARPCTCSATSWCSSTSPPPRPRSARSGSTGCSGTSTSATRGCSSGRRRSSPTWRWSGGPPV